MMNNGLLDLPRFLLAAAVRRMREERREWGTAMLSELAHLQHPSTRWRFALGCTRAALLPPRKIGLIQTVRSFPMKTVYTDIGSAALIGFLLVLPFAILELKNNIVTTQSIRGLFVLFGVLALLPMVFFILLMPIVRNVRAGTGIPANPISLSLRVAVLTLAAIMWGGLLSDQLPCFLGVPNCD